MNYLVFILKRPFSPNSSLFSKFNPWNIKHMPAVKFIERLYLEKNASFQDGNYLGIVSAEDSDY
tara:strand:- start:88 stop:279 length:192 start_codon:yes stop_codon:yes gene_type:complete